MLLRLRSCQAAQQLPGLQVLAVADTHHRHALPGLTRLSALQALHYLSLHKVPTWPTPLQLHSMQAGRCLLCSCIDFSMLL